MEDARDNSEMTHLLLVMAGGALGAAGRYSLSWVLPKDLWSVSTVNILGSFLAVYLFTYVLQGEANSNARFFAITGFLGAFTTFSAFSLESMNLLQENKHSLLLAYVLLNVVGSLGAAFLAWKLFANT